MLSITKRNFPSDFENKLLKFIENDRRNVRAEYNRLYDLNLNSEMSTISQVFANDLDNFESHNTLLSYTLEIFINPTKILNYQVVFVDPLYFAKKTGKISKIPTFDTVVAHYDDKIFKKFIFIEVKSKSPRTKFTTNDFIKYVSDGRLRRLFFTYITNSYPGFIISPTCEFEFVLVVQAIRKNDAISYVNSRSIPFIIWNILPDINQMDYRIELPDLSNSMNIGSSVVNSRHEDGNLRTYIAQTKFKFRSIVEFTHSMDVTLIISTIHELYIQKYGALIVDANLRSMINEIGSGHFYDDPMAVANLIGLIKQKGLEIGVIKQQSSDYYWKKVDVKKKIIDHRLDMHMSRKVDELFTLAIRNVHPRNQFRDLVDFL